MTSECWKGMIGGKRKKKRNEILSPFRRGGGEKKKAFRVWTCLGHPEREGKKKRTDCPCAVKREGREKWASRRKGGASRGNRKGNQGKEEGAAFSTARPNKNQTLKGKGRPLSRC